MNSDFNQNIKSLNVAPFVDIRAPDNESSEPRAGPMVVTLTMIKATQFARTSALPAIAAVLALSSTTSLAQQAQPTPAEPTTTPTTAAPSTTAPDVAPSAAQPSSSAADTGTAASSAPATVAPATAAKRTARAKAAPSHAATTRAASAAKPSAPVVTHKIRSATAAKSLEPSAPIAPPVVPLAAQAAAKPPAQAQPPAKASTPNNDTALEIGGGALALLALGGAAFAIARRRRSEDEEEWSEEQAYEETGAEPAVAASEPIETAEMPRHDPVAQEQSAIVAPQASAFSWGGSKEAASSSDDGSDRRPGETWVERAYRGPSAANPSVSLRNRLRRAAFFDKRERDVAAGTAVPVDAGAGLPDAMSEERELV